MNELPKSVELPALFNQRVLTDYLGKSEAWAERSRWDGTGPAYIKVGKAVRYRAQDVLAWIESGSRSSTSDKVGAK